MSRCYCAVCGADISQSMKVYPYGLKGGPYCYDCAEQDRIRKLTPPAADPIKRIVGMYKAHAKTSEIAEVMGMSPKEVYEILIEELDL